MDKNVQREANKGEKTQTKYDRKMEARKQKEAKDKKNEVMLRVGTIVASIVIVAAIVCSVGIGIGRKNGVLNKPYITVGSHDITKLEYDYYYHSTVNNYITNYGSLLQYMGIDTQKDFSEQMYSETLTWKDMFDQMTVEQITQTLVLSDDAAAKNFTYDTMQDYQNVVAGIESNVKENNISVSEYYKKTYGSYATERNIEPFIKQAITAGAYYKELLKQNAPNEEAVKAYYEENKQNYDKVDYRSFVFNAEIAEGASEDDIKAAVDGSEKKADAFMEEVKAGGNFESLCLKNAAEEEKANYESDDTEYSLSEGKNYSGIPTAISEWLYDDVRKDGDITVLTDETTHQTYVVEFIKKYYDTADDANISNTISADKADEYTNGLKEAYKVTDHMNQLKYLTVPAEASGQSEENADASGNGDGEADITAE